MGLQCIGMAHQDVRAPARTWTDCVIHWAPVLAGNKLVAVRANPARLGGLVSGPKRQLIAGRATIPCAMTKTYSIGELARAAEVPTSTVRYYERRGLLRPDGRSDSNYRTYGQQSLDLLLFIRAAQGTGFRLKDIELLIELQRGEGNPCGEVRTVIEARLEAIAKQMDELRHAQGVLDSALEWCRSGRTEGRCGVLDSLGQDPND